MDPEALLRTTTLGLHITAGVAGLALAGLILTGGTRQDWTSRAGRAYTTCVALVAVTALVMVTATSSLPVEIRWLLGTIAVATAGAACAGRALAPGGDSADARQRARHLRAMWASATSLVTAFAVVSTPAEVWIPVMAAGTLLSEIGYRSARRSPRWA